MTTSDRTRPTLDDIKPKVVAAAPAAPVAPSVVKPVQLLEPGEAEDAEAEDEESESEAAVNDASLPLPKECLAETASYLAPMKEGLPPTSFGTVLQGLQEAYTNNGKKLAGLRYAKAAATFLVWAKRKGLRFQDLPRDSIARFMNERQLQPAGRNITSASIRIVVQAAQAAGVVLPVLDFPKIQSIKKKKAPPMAQPAPIAAPPVVVEAPVQQPQQPLQPLQPQPVQLAQPIQSGQARRVVAAIPATGPDLMPTGHKYLVEKRATGFDPGHPPGSLIRVSTYPQAAVATAGGIQEFLQNNVVPTYGPRAGGPDVTYVVTVLDHRGHVVRTDDFAFAAPLGTPGQVPAQPWPPQVQPTQWQQPTAPPPAQQPPPPRATSPMEERMLERAIAREEAERVELKKQLEAAQQRTTDPMTLFVLMESLKKKDSELDRARDALERTREARETEAARPAPAVPPPGAFGPPMGMPSRMSFLDEPPPAPAKGPLDDIEKLAALIKALQPEKAVDTSQVDFYKQQLAREKEEREAMRAEQIRKEDRQEREAIAARAEAQRKEDKREAEAKEARDENRKLIEQISKPPDKNINGQLTELVTAMATVKKLEGVMGGGGGGPSVLGEVLGAIPDIIEKLGPLFMGRPPQLYPQQTLNEAPQAQPAVPEGKKVPPPEAQQALLNIFNLKEEGPEGALTLAQEQAIFEQVWALLQALRSGVAPWPQLFASVTAKIIKVDSKPEMRALVMGFLTNLGSNQIANSLPTVERITFVLHKHFAEIHKVLTGSPRVLADAVPIEGAEEEGDEGDDEGDEEGDEEDDEGDEDEGPEPELVKEKVPAPAVQPEKVAVAAGG